MDEGGPCSVVCCGIDHLLTLGVVGGIVEDHGVYIALPAVAEKGYLGALLVTSAIAFDS